MAYKPAYFMLAAVFVILQTSVSQAGLAISVGSPQMDLNTGKEVIAVAPVQGSVSTFRYGSPTGSMPAGIEATVISLQVVSATDPDLQTWYMLSVTDIRTETALLLREMMLSPQSFVLVVAEWQPVLFDRANSSRVRATWVQFPNGEVIPFAKLTARSIVTGRNTTLLKEVLRKIREKARLN